MMLAAACQDEGDIAAPVVQQAAEDRAASDSQETGKTLLTFTAGDGDASVSLQKTMYGDYANGTTPILWVTDDQVSVFPVSSSDNDMGTVKEGGKSDCVISVTTSEDANGYFALYPYNAYAEYSAADGKFSNIVIPAEQEVSENQFDPAADVMVAYSDGIEKSFAFKHIGTKLGITVPCSDVSEIQITCSADIAGTADVDFSNVSGAEPVISPKSDASTKTITLTCSDADGFKKGSIYYACLFPTADKSDIKITFVRKQGHLTVFYNAKINAMARAKRCTANPTGQKCHCLVTLDNLNKDENFPDDATKIVFGNTSQKPNADPSGNLDGLIDFYKVGTEYYIISEHEICMNGSLDEMFLYLNNHYEALKTVDFCNFNTENVTSMYNMFNKCSALTIIDLGDKFITSKVTDMGQMFGDCKSLKTIFVKEDFQLDKETSSANMFTGCQALVGGNNTKYSDSYKNDASYARIDGSEGKRGYFTKRSSSN